MSADWPIDSDDDNLNAVERLEPLALLLIEDSPADSRLLQEHLRDAIQRGEVMMQVVRRLSDATQALNRMEFSCVLVDLGLPDGQGVATIEALRAVDPDVAMVVLTGFDSDDMAQQTMQLGVQDYLVKGRYDAGLLLRRIRFAVQNHRQLVQLNTARQESFASASQDPVTGLPNRPLFEDRARRAIAFAERTGCELGIVYVGIDGLPAGGDDASRIATDALIRRIGTLLAESVRKSDTVAATGGGEFVSILVPTDVNFDAVIVARRFNEMLRTIDAAPLQLVPFIGVAVYPRDGETLDELVEHAEQAMFRALRAGGGVCVWEGQVTAHPASIGAERLWSGSPLDALVPLYQPWFDLREQRFVGVEVLWSASDAIAYRTASLDTRREAGFTLIRTALSQLRVWRDGGFDLPSLGLNLDSVLLEQPDLASFLRDQLAARNLPPQDIRLEVPAEVLADATPELLSRLRLFRDEGYGVVLDDYLSGADGLLAISTMPLDGIKIGRDVVATLPTDRPGGSVRRAVTAAIGASTSLSLDLIATGVDDDGRRQQLRTLGCRYLQGDALCEALIAAELPMRWRIGPPTFLS
ncbi:GGDEF domain-containing response regulator [Nevskia sp.]|uniref:GGDEF domain-containing response regulator n=1 Tax=Nevskia sp. TaxID=1929292 RepID=UPI0025F9C9C4|nr:GGDEF domain-containing response regulator [Nevskia sp.]